MRTLTISSLVCTLTICLFSHFSFAQVNSCGGSAANYEYCYGNDESGILFAFEAASPTDQVSIVFNAGTLEQNFDFLTIYGTGNLLFQTTGELAGTVFEAPIGATISIVLSSDGSVSCDSNAQTALNFDVYCGNELTNFLPGCTDQTACNYDAAAEQDNGSCDFDSCTGCTDPLAFNFDAAAGATIDDGSCFYAPNCGANETIVSFQMFDSFGDGWNGANYTIKDSFDNVVATGNLDTATYGDASSVTTAGNNVNFGVEFFCLIDDCYTIAVTNGNFGSEVSWVLTNEISGETLTGGATDGDQEIFSVNLVCEILSCDDPDYDVISDPLDCFLILGDVPCDAIPVFCDDVIFGDNAEATLAGVETADYCGGNIAPGIWYVFSGDGTQWTFNTCGNGTGTDTEIHAFTASDCNDFSTFSCIGANDDGAGCDGNGFQSTLSVFTPLGEDVYVHVGRYSFGVTGVSLGVGGSFTLEVTCSPDGICEGFPFQANYVCEDAIALQPNQETTGFSCGFSNTTAVSCAGFSNVQGVWYSYAISSNAINIDLINLENDPSINIGASVFIDQGGAGGCDDAIAAGEVLCVAPTITQYSGVLSACFGHPAIGAGDIAYIYVWHNSFKAGDFSITVSDEECGCTNPGSINYNPNATIDDGSCETPPQNDLCENAIQISCADGSISSSLGVASADGLPDGASPGVWYQIIGTGDQVNLYTCGSFADTALDVYTGECGETSLVSIASNDNNADFCSFTDADDAAVTFVSTAGQNYFIYVSNSNEASNIYSFELTIECEPIVLGCTNPLAQNYDATANTEADPSTCDLVWEDACAGINVTDFCFGNNEAYIITYSSGDPLSIPRMTMNGGTIGFETFNVYDGTNTLAPLVASEANVLFDGTQVYNGTSGFLTFEFQTGAFGSCLDGANMALSYSVDCVLIAEGCTDSFAFNYDINANIENGSCVYEDNEACGKIYSRCYGEGTQTLSFSSALGANEAFVMEITNGTVALVNDSFSIYDGPDNTSPLLNPTQMAGNFAGTSWVASGASLTIEWIGDANSNCADGDQTEFDFSLACKLLGCTDPLAINYNTQAEVDDGSCEYLITCTGDIDGNSEVGISDLLTVSSSLGVSCSGCAADLDSSGDVSVGDLLLVAGLLGSTCE